MRLSEASFGNQLATKALQLTDSQVVSGMGGLIVDQEVPSSTLGASTNAFSNLQ